MHKTVKMVPMRHVRVAKETSLNNPVSVWIDGCNVNGELKRMRPQKTNAISYDDAEE